MYYSTELFIKKGSMGKIWLAGTLGQRWSKKFSKKEILSESIGGCCEQIQSPPIPLAFAAESILMYGTVVIYHFHVVEHSKHANQSYERLVKYARKTRDKTKIDLPPQQRQADSNEITLQQRPVHVDVDVEADFEFDLDIGEMEMEVMTIDMDDIDLDVDERNKLMAPEETITMRRRRIDTPAPLRVERGLFDVGMADALEMDMDIDLDLGIEELDERSVVSRPSMEREMRLPELEPSALDEFELPHALTASSVEQIAQMHPIVLPSTPSAIELEQPMAMAAAAAVSPSPPISEATVIAVPPGERVAVGIEAGEDAEEPSQLTPVTPAVVVVAPPVVRRVRADRREATKPKRVRKRRKRKFERDEHIQLPTNQRLIDFDDTQQRQEFTVERPLFTHIEERSVNQAEFDQLFTTSLTGLYHDNRLQSGFREFTEMILNPRIERQRMQEDLRRAQQEMAQELPPSPPLPRVSPIPEEFLEHVEPEEPVEPSHEAAAAAEEPAPEMDITAPEIGYGVARKTSVSPSVSVSELSSDRFAGYKIPSISAASSSVERDAFLQQMAMAAQKKISSSDEPSVPPNISRLTAFFKHILSEEMNKLQRFRLEEQEEEEEEQEQIVAVDLEQMLTFHAQQNETNVNRRDMALGFMQTLILKNEDMIEVEQQEWNGAIHLMKGPRFDIDLLQ